MGMGSLGPLVGRAEQLDVLRRSWGLARAGEPQFVLVIGEPGIGKTRLVSELVADLDASVRVLATQCLELAGAAVPLAPVQDLVHGAFRLWGGQAVRDASGPYLPVLAVLEPALLRGGDVPGSSLVADQRQIFSAMRHLLEQLADAGPLLVLVEDVQWADEATLDLLRYLAVALRDVPVLLVATSRIGTSATQRVITATGHLPHATTLELGDLAPDEATALVEVLVGASARPGRPSASPLDIDRVVELSGGNPLYLEELVAAGPSESLPSSLRSLLLSRLLGLSEPARFLVDLVSVGDPPVRYDDLLAATGWPEQGLDEVLAEARSAGVLTVTTPASRVALRHPLVGDAAREDIDLGRRRSLHRAWAMGLSESSPRSPQTALVVAHHWDNAAEPRPALRAAWQGAEAALALQAHGTRAALLDRVERLWASSSTDEIPVDQVEVLAESARAHELAGSYPEAAARLDKALALLERGTDPSRSASLLVARGRLEFEWRDASPERYLQRALGLLPDTADEGVRGRLLAEWADYLTLTEQFPRAHELAAEAVRLARASGDQAAEALALLALARACWLEDPGPAVEMQRAAMRLAEQAGAYDVLVGAMEALAGGAYIQLGDHRQASADLADAIGVARRHGLDAHFATGGMLTSMGGMLLESGDLDAAVAVADEAEKIFGDHGASNYCRAIRATVHLIRGHAGGARAELAGIVPSPHDPTETADLDPKAWLTWLEEGPEAAAAVVLPFLQGALDRGNDYALIWQPEVVYALARYLHLSQPILDPESDAAATLDAVRAVFRRVRTNATLVAVLDAVLGDLGGTNPAERWRVAAATFTDTCGPAYWRIQTLIWLAGTTPNRAEAHAALDAAEGLARRLGSQAQLDEVDACRRRVTGNVGPAGLTPREMEILNLVDQGLTNNQIAQRLFISRSTAGVHISHILTKTDTRSRQQAAQWGREHGLIHHQFAPPGT
jgi:DNA-binding CsgD family transcriptional regulator/tetratricopeptide (TPR) repeat protein